MLISIARSNRAAGSIDISPTVIPNGLTRVIVTIDRFAFPANDKTEVAKGTVEVSYDEGKTWPVAMPIAFAGGKLFRKKGQQFEVRAPFSQVAFNILDTPGVTPPPRRVRLTLANSSTLNIGGSIEVL